MIETTFFIECHKLIENIIDTITDVGVFVELRTQTSTYVLHDSSKNTVRLDVRQEPDEEGNHAYRLFRGNTIICAAYLDEDDNLTNFSNCLESDKICTTTLRNILQDLTDLNGLDNKTTKDGPKQDPQQVVRDLEGIILKMAGEAALSKNDNVLKLCRLANYMWKTQIKHFIRGNDRTEQEIRNLEQNVAKYCIKFLRKEN